jgi:AbrB family looped-hinge helix DNA binding protein
MGNASAVSRLTSKGQVTIPAAVRFALGLSEGDELLFGVADGRGVFRRTRGVDGAEKALGAPCDDAARPLERLVTVGDAELAGRIRAARTSTRKVRLRDALVLDALRRLLESGRERDAVVRALEDLLADRGVRPDDGAALERALTAAREGGDPLAAYTAV